MVAKHWTEEGLRFALDCQERRYAAAMDCKDYELAERLAIQRDKTWEELQELIKDNRREFEWHNTPDWTSAWYDTSAELN
jgi:hypothetical protein